MSVIWYAVDDAAECEDCQANADQGESSDGTDWPSGSAPVHPNCRCVEIELPDPQQQTDDNTDVADALTIVAAVAAAVEAHKASDQKADPAGHLTAIDDALAGTGATLLTKHHNKPKPKKGRAVQVTNERQFRNVRGTFTPVGNPEDRTFTARVCNYNQVDTYGTSWAPGVFTHSLSRKLPAAVWSHDWNRPIGRVVSFEDGPDGLDVTVKMADFDAVPDARMAYSLLRDGIFDEYSFAFLPEDGEEDPNHRGVLRFTRAQLDEVSPVLVGSVPGTKTVAVRSDEQVGRAAATEILRRFAAGELELDGALTELKTRATVTEASLPKNSNGTDMTNMKMRNVPHSYKATNGDGSVCEVCGGQPDLKAHRGVDPSDTRAVSDMLAGYGIAEPGVEDDDMDPGTLAAGVDACIDDAIMLFASLDTTTLPMEVQQAIALIQAADVVVDQLMDALGVPDPDEQVQDGSMRSAEPDPDLLQADELLEQLLGD